MLRKYRRNAGISAFRLQISVIKEYNRPMDTKYVKKILKDTAYIRTGGSREEKKCAEYLMKRCEELGAEARIEEFTVQAADDLTCTLTADGQKIECLGYRN